MTKNGFKDTRLLEALDYIDQDLIGEVAVKLNFEESAVLTEEPVMTWRTPFKHWKRMLATVACLLLLSAAFPVLDYAVQRFGIGTWEGNAGAGTEELEVPTAEETQALETEDKTIDSPYPRAIDAYPADMSIAEIYDDIIKGGWVVLDSDYEKGFLYGNELWTSFIDKVNMKQPATVLVADMARWSSLHPSVSGWQYSKPRHSTLFLMEIVFDGTKFTYKRINCSTDEITDSGEYKYLITDIYEYKAEYNPGLINGYCETFCLTNDISWTYENFINQAYTDEGRTPEFFSNPCQIVASYTPVYETSNEEAYYPHSASLGFSELIVD